MTMDPSKFLDAVYTEANATELKVVDEGEYQAQAGEVTTESFQGVKDPSKTYVKVIVPWVVDSEAMKAKTGRSVISIRQDFLLDLTPDGMLDMGEGKNVQLGRLREALGLNVKGVPFQFRAITGRMAKIAVKHRNYEGRTFEEVKAVAKL